MILASCLGYAALCNQKLVGTLCSWTQPKPNGRQHNRHIPKPKMLPWSLKSKQRLHLPNRANSQSRITTTWWEDYGWNLTNHPIKMICWEDAATLNQIIERDRIVEFLAGLNPEFDQVRVQILGKDKLSNLNEVFVIVRSEENRRYTMLIEHTIEGSALVINK